MKRNLILHLGAHKTATTYLQDTLYKNNNKLSKHDIYFINREDFRDKVTVPNFYPKNVKNPLQSTLESYLLDLGVTSTNIVLSEENLIGLIFEQTNILMYKNSYDRLLKLKEFIGDDFTINNIYFCIRSYDTYFASLYCEHLKNHKFYPFQNMKNKIIQSDYSWQSVVDLITDTFEGVDFKFWTYEDFSKNIDYYLDALSFNKDIKFEKPNKVIRKGFSNKSISVLTYIYNKHGSDFVTEKVKNMIITEFDNKSTNKFYPFNRLERSTIERMYNNDISTLEKNYIRLRP